MLLIHGGGWRSGSREHMIPVAKFLAEHGIAAAAISYRTSRQALYPAGMEDIENALKWVSINKSKYSLNMQKVGLLGASSGAHMATLLGHRLNNVSQSSIISAVVNFDGVVETTSDEVRFFEDRPGKISYMALWLGGRFNEQTALWQEVSPLNYTDQYSPATFFVNSSQPRFHRGRDEMLAILQEFKITHGFYEIPETPHTFWLFHPWHDDAMQRTVDFLANVFGQKSLPQPRSLHTLDRDQLAKLPDELRHRWQNYFDQSDQLLKLDAQSLANEPLSNLEITWQKRHHYKDISITQEILDNLLSWQTPSGGWSKNHDVTLTKRLPGQPYGEQAHYVPTFDNGATFAEIEILRKALVHYPELKYKTSLHRAIRLILQAQFPSGGWPQTYPLRGGYHNWSTYNDGVTANILNLLLDIVQNPAAFALPPALQKEVQIALGLGIQSVLSEQRWIKPNQAAWGQQHDPLSGDLRPARAFEMAALSTMESADIALFLMRLGHSDAAINKAIQGAMNWLISLQIQGKRWRRYPDKNSELIEEENAPPLWPRMIDMNTGEALFGDRDSSIHKQISEISIERQRSYGWYHNGPISALQEYEKWLKQH